MNRDTHTSISQPAQVDSVDHCCSSCWRKVGGVPVTHVVMVFILNRFRAKLIMFYGVCVCVWCVCVRACVRACMRVHVWVGVGVGVGVGGYCRCECA